MKKFEEKKKTLKLVNSGGMAVRAEVGAEVNAGEESGKVGQPRQGSANQIRVESSPD